LLANWRESEAGGCIATLDVLHLIKGTADSGLAHVSPLAEVGRKKVLENAGGELLLCQRRSDRELPGSVADAIDM
jgi:hypothetical protein